MTHASPPGLSKHDLLTDLLRRVSRSFYLTLRVLPSVLRDQIGLAYLFARAADTVADTNVLERSRRLECLRQFQSLFRQEPIHWPEIHAIQQAVMPHHAPSPERLLVERLEDCFRLFLELDEADRERIRDLLLTLTPGMELDLTVFPGDRAEELVALRSMQDLDRYIYHVAGCVGEFWTRMISAHLSSLADWNVHHMARIGVRFGKGLQLTNVLRDVARDLRRGRCYLPEELLHDCGLKPEDLLDQRALPALRPALKRLLTVALEHLDQGWLYTLAIPRREVRLRLACMWPLLFAGETLKRVAVSPALLDPAGNVKMPRGQVYRLIGLTILTGANGALWVAYWGRARKQIL